MPENPRLADRLFRAIVNRHQRNVGGRGFPAEQNQAQIVSFQVE
jgi:hypothetical protein